jgi:hypothetical protein
MKKQQQLQNLNKNNDNNTTTNNKQNTANKANKQIIRPKQQLQHKITTTTKIHFILC